MTVNAGPVPVLVTDNADVIDTIVSLHVISPVTVKSPATVTSLLKDLSPAIVCEPQVLTTVLSTSISFELAVIPSPPITLTVTLPELPPPVIPVPAVTPVISPVHVVYPALLLNSLLLILPLVSFL